MPQVSSKRVRVLVPALVLVVIIGAIDLLSFAAGTRKAVPKVVTYFPMR